MTELVFDFKSIKQGIDKMHGKGQTGHVFTMDGRQISGPQLPTWGTHRPDSRWRRCAACGSALEEILDNVVSDCAYASASLAECVAERSIRRAMAQVGREVKAVAEQFAHNIFCEGTVPHGESIFSAARSDVEEEAWRTLMRGDQI